MSFLFDIRYIFSWWLLLFSLGIVFLPLTFLLFSKFIDKAYLFSRVIGFCLLTYSIFVLSSFHLLKFTSTNILIILFLFFLINYYLIQKNKIVFLSFIKKNFRILIFEELLFIFILFFWSYVRGLAPNIEGLEKFMDWGFINTSLRSEYLPPQDMWFAGSSINYYFFGHLYFALLTKLSGISSAITYNLSIATLATLTFSLSFSLIFNLCSLKFSRIKIKKIIFLSLIGSWFLTFSGNLHPVYKIFQDGFDAQKISQNIHSYWYPDATRFIGHDPETSDKTIHEFPIYSFVVSDLHGHVNDIPIVLLFVSLCLSFALSKKKFSSFNFLIFGSLILSWAYTTNAWDFAIYGLFFAILSILLTKNIRQTLFSGIILILFWYLFSLPFSRNFSPMAQGISISDAKSPFYQLFILYGGFWLICLPFIFIKKKLDPTTIFNLSLIILATLLVLIPEFIYIKDIYTSDYRRANTMFKLVYQSFILYSLSLPYCFFSVTNFFKNKFIKIFYIVIFIFVFISHASYLYFSLPGYYFYRSRPVYQGLYGMNFLKNSHYDNFNAVNWLNQNISGQPVVLEASGDSYTLFNHVSATTGLPTPVGWLVHEWLWRNGYDAPASRQTDVQNLYTTPDYSLFLSLIDKYQIEYIFVGDQEIEKYQSINTANFDQIGAKIVFQSGDTKIYQLPK